MATCLSFVEALWMAFSSHFMESSKSILMAARLPNDQHHHIQPPAVAWPRELEISAKQYCQTLTATPNRQLLLQEREGVHVHSDANKTRTLTEFQVTVKGEDPSPTYVSSRFFSNGNTKCAALYTRKGDKDINQDSMLIIEDFTRLDDDDTTGPPVVFCGVFDGHGPHGHFVSRCVRDTLPQKLLSCWHSISYEAMAMQSSASSGEDEREFEDDSSSAHDAPPSSCYRRLSLDSMSMFSTWKDSFVRAYELMDLELSMSRSIDCISSGTTAVSLVKLGNDLLVGNVGDSRAVLATEGSDGTIVAVQLTVDTRPDIPSEAERIKKCNGRIRALRHEPFVKRVWLPNHNAPGLAMSRALGDFCIKRYGVISEPEVTHRRLTSKDKFVVLASDGVWDVLSNEEVVAIVASTSDRSTAAEAVVEAAVEGWKEDYETSKVDDCSVVCLFLQDDDIQLCSS